MTALQLAKSECANHEPDGTCLGVNIRDDLSQAVMSHAGQRCRVACGERCRYFEEIVLPLVEMTRDTKRLAEFTEAESDYEEKRKNEQHTGTSERDMERGVDSGSPRREAESTRQPASEARFACRPTGARRAGVSGRGRTRMGSRSGKRGQA